MTLIAVLAHPDYLLVVADTLITIPGTKGERQAIDNACKLAQVDYFGVLAFSGLAKIEGIRAHRWATEHLADWNLRGGEWEMRLFYLQEKATAAFQRFPLCGERHAFLFAEWVRDVNQELVINMYAISNALDDQLNWLPKAKGSFEVKQRLLTPTMFSLSTLGAQVSDSELREVCAPIVADRSLPRNQALKLLQDFIVRKSVDKKMGVGSEVMSLCIPKSTVGKPMLVINSDPDTDMITYRHINGVGEPYREDAPLMLVGNEIFQFWAEDDGITQSASVKFIRINKRRN